MTADYLLDEDFDLRIEDGDFISGESTTQHQDLLMMLNKGELRQFPKTGVGVVGFLNDDLLGDLYGEINTQFRADGMTVRKVVVTQDGKVQVEAFYE